jgi:hypothetical protein
MNEIPKTLVSDHNPKVFGQLAKNAKLVWKLLQDKRVPLLLKLLPMIGVLWLIFPDFAPGPIDDAAAVFISSYLFIELCPKEVVEELRKGKTPLNNKEDRDNVVEAEWKEV